jgi:hypothetical protein
MPNLQSFGASHPMTNPAADAARAAAASPTRTGLERECLRQAIHDVRGPLNTSSVLVDLITALLDKDPALARTKAPLVVRELQTVARMLDHLVGTSDTLVATTTSIDLGETIAGAVGAFAVPPGVSVDCGAVPRPTLVLACPTRLPRLLAQLLDRCAASVPRGGEIVFSVEPVAGAIRVVATVRGDGIVLPAEGRPHLTAGPSSWFPLLALARGIGGDLRLTRADAALRVELELLA